MSDAGSLHAAQRLMASGTRVRQAKRSSSRRPYKCSARRRHPAGGRSCRSSRSVEPNLMMCGWSRGLHMAYGVIDVDLDRLRGFAPTSDRSAPPLRAPPCRRSGRTPGSCALWRARFQLVDDVRRGLSSPPFRNLNRGSSDVVIRDRGTCAGYTAFRLSRSRSAARMSRDRFAVGDRPPSSALAAWHNLRFDALATASRPCDRYAAGPKI